MLIETTIRTNASIDELFSRVRDTAGFTVTRSESDQLGSHIVGRSEDGMRFDVLWEGASDDEISLAVATQDEGQRLDAEALLATLKAKLS